MADIKSIRQQYPQYDDLSDTQLADAFHSKFYSDIPKEDFYGKIGIKLDKPAGFEGLSLNDLGIGDSKTPIPGSASVIRYGVNAIDNGLPFVGSFSDEITSALGALGGSAYSQFTDNPQSVGDVYDTARQQAGERQAFEQKNDPGVSALTTIGGGLLGGAAALGTAPGAAIASRIGSGLLPEATGIAGRGANLASKIALGGGSGAASGALYGAGDQSGEGRTANAGQGAVLGGLFGAATPALISGVGGAVNSAKGLLAPTIDDATRTLAQRANSMDIPLKISQLGESKPAKIVDSITSQLPFSGAQGFEDSQKTAFNKALANTIGQDSDNLGPDTIKQFHKDNGKVFNSVLEGEKIPFSNDFNDSIDSLVDDAANTVDPNLASVVKKNGDYLKSAFADGDIDGEKVASVRSELLKRQARSEGPVKQYLGDMIDHIDDHVGDALPQSKTDALQKARLQYRNFKTIEPLLEKSQDGNVSPAALMQRVAASKYIKASSTATGDDDLVDLSRIGQRFLKSQVPDSGTAQRSIGLKALVGGGLGSLGLANLPAALTGLAVGRGLQSVNRNQALVAKALSGVRPASNLLPSNASGILSLSIPAPARGLFGGNP